ncbi:MAG: hypothetical protein GF350_00095, partial [Chitinivibrionales bacterium]|nr:hypothetical protein [Chitinivibrionales bacterium]
GYCKYGSYSMDIFNRLSDFPASNFYIILVKIGDFKGIFKLLHFRGNQYTISGFHSYAPFAPTARKANPVYKDTLVISKNGYQQERVIATYGNLAESTYVVPALKKADFFSHITDFSSSFNFQQDTVVLRWKISGWASHAFVRIYATTHTTGSGTPDRTMLIPAGESSFIPAADTCFTIVQDNHNEIVYYTLRPATVAGSDTVWGRIIPYEEIIYPSALVSVYNEDFESYLDRRFIDLDDYTTVYSMPGYTARYEWDARSDYLEKHIRITNGLWPSLEKTPLNTLQYGTVEYDSFAVDKVCFESFPGFYVTGNVYRPVSGQGPFPAILCPHGHWSRGRFESTGRVNVPARCITFARKGFVNFSYDMVGYNDSRQFPHRFNNPAAHLWGINAMSLHMMNSIRALDYLLSLPDIDTTRVGCTGASGGATQTFMLAAVDDRITASAPVNHISAHLQDGCICGNAPGMRIVTFNVEIGALFAPKPLFIVSATRDWTCNTPTVEFPAIQQIYSLYGAENNVGTVQINNRHNYDKNSRESVYAFFGEQFCADSNEANWKEPEIPSYNKYQFMLFNGTPLPQRALDSADLVQAMIDSAESQFAAQVPSGPAGYRQFENIYKTALAHLLCISEPQDSEIELLSRGVWHLDSIMLEKMLIYRKGFSDYIPVILLWSRRCAQSGRAVLCVDGEGKYGLVDEQSGSFSPVVQRCLENGDLVCMADCFNAGEHVMPYSRYCRQDSVEFFDSYNRADAVEAAQDIVTVAAYLGSRETIDKIAIVAGGDAGLWTLLALSQTDRASTAIVDVGKFDNRNNSSYLARLNIPSFRRYGGIDIAVAFTQAENLLIHNTGDSFATELIESLAAAAGKEGRITVKREKTCSEKIADRLCIQK